MVAENPLLDSEAVRARVENWKQRTMASAEKTQEAAGRLQALRVSAMDPNGIVEVTVDSGGALLDVRLSPRVQRQSPEYTQVMIMDAYRQARVRLAEAAREVVEETIGSTSQTGSAILASFTPGPDYGGAAQ